MRKWLTLIILALLAALPSLAAAQTETRLASLEVKLWPEYDQPSMLVIYDFQVAESLSLPARLEFHLPAEASLNAVAALQNGKFLNTPSEGPVVQGEWQVLTIPVSAATAYRIEYYQPLSISGPQRQFSFLWYGDHAVESFRVSLQQPVDASNMSTDPPLEPVQETDGLTYFNSVPLSLQQGEQFSLNLGYEKTTDRLTVPSNDIQPSAPLDANTDGRVSVSNYLPYILGALGVILLVGGLGYNFLWRKPRPAQVGRRRRVRPQPAEETESEVYCHQCGQRARPGDRFCRVCGTRLRLPPES